MALGKGIGHLAYYLARGRRHIAEVNLKQCFPSKSDRERQALVRQNMVALGMGLMETATAWLRSPESFAHRFSIEGLHHLESAVNKGQGVLLLGFHFTTMDLAAAYLATLIPMGAMYRKNKNPVIDYMMFKGRARNLNHVIEREDIKGLIKTLRQGGIVWYGPDQDYGRKYSVFVPFFDVETATIKATARIARMSKAQVIVFRHYRQAGDKAYTIQLSGPLEDYPCDDPATDARRINSLVEEAVLMQPEQYWWIHRRFKTRPAGQERPY